MEAATKRGDIYKAVGDSHTHPVTASQNEDGTVFQAVARNVTFEEWELKQNHGYWVDEKASPDGYHRITTDMITEGSMSYIATVGIFVPRGLDLRTVADGVRREFGAGSALLKEDTPKTS